MKKLHASFSVQKYGGCLVKASVRIDRRINGHKKLALTLGISDVNNFNNNTTNDNNNNDNNDR